MSQEEIKVSARGRSETGSGQAGRLRREGVLPGVVYGGHAQSTSIQVDEHEMVQILRQHASGNVLLDLDVDGTKDKVLLKDVQHHPLTGRLLHVDFRRISMTDKLRVTVPVELVGEPLGVTQEGGTLERLVHDVELECLPTDIPEEIRLDVSGLQVGDTLRVSDLSLDATKQIVLTAEDVAVASVSAPRVEEEPVEGEGEEVPAEAGAEPEVIGEKKEAEGEETAEQS